ncbi:hypothetical protein BCC0191_000956 [Burkholderia ambifaria]
MVQPIAYIARRPRGLPAVPRQRCPITVVDTTADRAEVDVEADADVGAGSGCQWHARCGRSTLMQDVVSVARQYLPGRNLHSWPNDGM